MKNDRVDESIQKTLDLLAESPPRLSALTQGIAPVQWKTAPNPGEWSANEVLAHLRACADVWGGCIATILGEDKPRFRAVNPRTYIKSVNYLDLEFQPSLEAFIYQRVGLLPVLKALSPEDWLRSATVYGAGRPLIRTTLSYADLLARHERTHVKQIARIVKTIRRG